MRQRSAAWAVARLAPAAAGLLATTVVLVWTLSNDARSDAAAIAVEQVPWPAVAALALLPILSAVHYACAALALRATSGRSLPLPQTMLAQLAAAATSRIVPSGLGAAGVNFRYLVRDGLPAGAATSAIAALAVVGGATDAAYASAVTVVGPAFGITGAATEMRALAESGVRAGHSASWVLLAALVVALLVALHRRPGLDAVRRATSDLLRHARTLSAHPGRLVTAFVASTTTTMVLSAGFVVAVDVWGNSPTPLPAGALVAVYLVAAAVGGSAPLPAVCLLTEGALVGGLVLDGYAPGSALLAVVIFRVVTFWLPLPVGLWAARRLRIAGRL